MRYWVYINDKVIEKPYEEGELASIPGFNSNTLICKETPAEGETQDWVPAKNLIAAYRQPAPPPPPTQQNIDKFASAKQENQSTILSSNIFGSADNNVNLYKSSNTTDPTKTESISPQEESSFEEDIFNDVQTTEVVSIDDVKEIDVDTHISQDSESEEDILKTAIRTLITPEKTRSSEEQTFQAIDIAHNRNIDLSEPQEENIDKLVSTIKEEKGTQNIFEEQTAETETQNPAEAKLTLLGASKTGINHLFAVDENAPKEEPAEQPAPQEEQAVSQETPVEQPASQEEQAVSQETPAQTPVEQPVSQEEQVNSQEEQSAPQQKDNNIIEEDFLPEEEISLDDDDIIVNNLSDDKDVLTKEEPSAKEQEVLQELVADKEEDLKAAKQDEEELEEAFKTAPALVSELAQEKKVEDVIQEPNNILEPSVEVQHNEEVPMTLDELTGRIPSQEENQSEEIVPAEVHPDVIVEEVKEEGTPAETPEENKEENKEPQPEQDNFLNTFSSDIETVFLDQPTAFISDYIPPEATKDLAKEMQQEAEKEAQGDILDIKSSQGQHQVQNVRRVKPAAIKTVPIVDGEQVDPFSKTQIKRFEVAEEAKAKIEERNKKLTFVIILVLAIVAVLLLVGLIGLVAQIGFFPKDLSPIHTFAAKISHKNTNSAEGSNTKLTPEELALQDLKDAEKLRINKIITEVKNYKLMEGITLEEKIKLLHPTMYNSLKWEAAQESDLTYYDIQVSSPANEEGYSQVSYSFKYNTVTYTVEARNTDSNNVLIAPFKS